MEKEYDLGDYEMKFLMELVLDSLGPSSEVVDYIKKRAEEEGMTFEDFMSTQTAKRILADGPYRI